MKSKRKRINVFYLFNEELHVFFNKKKKLNDIYVPPKLNVLRFQLTLIHSNGELLCPLSAFIVCFDHTVCLT